MAAVIHVELKPEPTHFDAEVRQKGRRFLEKKKIPTRGVLPEGTKLEPFWKACMSDLHNSYAGICAYLAVYIELALGGASVDHFVAKSKRVELAYEWSNYRLACSRMNTLKREYEDVLDPCEIRDGMFRLEPVSGRIHPADHLDGDEEKKVQQTIKRLKLDDPWCRKMRLRYIQQYIDKEISVDFLRRNAPFVHMELRRQNLL